MDTPAGPFTAIVDDDGAVRAAGLTADVDELLPLIHPGLRGRRRGTRARPRRGDRRRPAYLDGDLTAIDDVPVRQHSGGAFLGHAWEVLREVKPGAAGHLHRSSPAAGRPPGRDPGRRPGLRPQRGRAVRAVPPGAAHRRHARRLPLGTGRQEVASRPRAACRRKLTRRDETDARRGDVDRLRVDR